LRAAGKKRNQREDEDAAKTGGRHHGPDEIGSGSPCTAENSDAAGHRAGHVLYFWA
jgi:hypothetical protein